MLVTRAARIDPDAGVLKFIEIKTKLTSILVFAYCLAFAYQIELKVNGLPTLSFFLGTLLIDLATTSINNYQGYKRENEVLSVQPKNGRRIIGVLLLSAVSCGLLLVYLTADPLILISGAFCFLIGLTYTTGPLPISHTPFGEAFSGILYGFFIPLIFALINLPSGQLMALSLSDERLSISIEWRMFLALLALAAMPVALVANVMLANNYCDVKKDEAVGRFTLPHYLGKKALSLYAFLNLFHYPLIVILVFLKVLLPWQLLVLLTAPVIYKNTRRFLARQDKATTFGLALQNLLLVMGALTLSLLLGGLFSNIFA